MGDNNNNENTRRALAETRAAFEAQKAAELARETALLAEKPLTFEEQERLAFEASLRNAPNPEELNLNLLRAIAESKETLKKESNEAARKLLEETGETYKKTALNIALQFLEGNTNQLRRDALVLQMETDAIFSVSQFRNKNTKEQKTAKDTLKQIQDRLTKITSGDEDLDENFIIGLPIRLVKEVYRPLGLNRKEILTADKNYQIVKKIRDDMDMANAARIKSILDAKRSDQQTKEQEELRQIFEEQQRKEQERGANVERITKAIEARNSAKSSFNTTKGRYNKIPNPRLKERLNAEEATYKKAQEEYTKIREEYLKKYPGSAAGWAEGGRRTRKERKSKKSNKTRSHK